MKIGVLGLRGVPDVSGGIETHCEHLYSRIAPLRPQDEFTIIGRSAYIGKEPYQFKPGVRVVPLASVPHPYLETISNSIIGAFAARFRLKADILHVHGIGPGLVVPLAKLFGLRTVLTHHGDDFNRAKWNAIAKWSLRFGEYVGVTFSDRVIAVSPSLAERLQSQFPERAQDIQYVPNGADHFRREKSERAGYLEQFGLEAGSYIVSVGRLVPEKGFSDLVVAHARSGIKAKLVIVGGNGNSSYDETLRAEAGDNVVFTGNMPHEGVAELVQASGLFVLASHHEGLPIAALEALAVEAPILVSDIVPNKDLGLGPEHYFRVGDVNDLSTRLVEAFKAKPRSPLHPRFNWSQIAQAISHVYDGMVSKSQAPLIEKPSMTDGSSG